MLYNAQFFCCSLVLFYPETMEGARTIQLLHWQTDIPYESDLSVSRCLLWVGLVRRANDVKTIYCT